MPNFDYTCSKCSKTYVDVQVSISESDSQTCRKGDCDGKLVKMLNSFGIGGGDNSLYAYVAEADCGGCGTPAITGLGIGNEEGIKQSLRKGERVAAKEKIFSDPSSN